MTGLPLFVLLTFLACAIVGVWGFVSPQRPRPVLAAVIALVFVLASVGVAIGGIGGLALVAFGLLLGILLVLQTEQVVSLIGRVITVPRRFPRLVFGVLAVGGVAGVAEIVWSAAIQRSPTPEGYLDQEELVRLIPVDSIATTDARRPVAIFQYGEPVPTEMTPADKKFISMVDGGLLFTGYHGGCNCHGWIFAGGRFWILNDAVPAILRDNGYQPVSEPTVGDLVVYWNESRQPIHSGIVRAVPKEGPIRIESKWGMRGQFVHTPQGQVFSKSLTYFRSSRQGHLLQGLDDSLTEESAKNGRRLLKLPSER